MNKIVKKIFFPLIPENINLETKIWHRLIKVVFIIFMFFIFIFSILILELDTNIKKLSFVDENKVQQDIETAKTKKLTEEEFFNKVDLIKEIEPLISDEEAIKIGLELAKEKGYTIDGIDIDQELQALGYQPTQEELKNKKYFIGYYLLDILKLFFILYITLILGQFIYYKMILYVIYGKNER